MTGMPRLRAAARENDKTIKQRRFVYRYKNIREPTW